MEKYDLLRGEDTVDEGGQVLLKFFFFYNYVRIYLNSRLSNSENNFN